MEKEVRLIQSIQRAFNIIDCFNNDNTELSLPQISEKVKLHINTTRGIVNTLVANGYLACNAEKNTYCLGLVYITKADLATGNNIKRLRTLAARASKILPTGSRSRPCCRLSQIIIYLPLKI